MVPLNCSCKLFLSLFQRICGHSEYLYLRTTHISLFMGYCNSHSIDKAITRDMLTMHPRHTFLELAVILRPAMNFLQYSDTHSIQLAILGTNSLDCIITRILKAV